MEVTFSLVSLAPLPKYHHMSKKTCLVLFGNWIAESWTKKHNILCVSFFGIFLKLKDDQFDIFQFYLYLEEVDGVVKMVTTVDFTHVALKLKAFKNTG